MYTIYADDVCIYNDEAAEVSARLISPVLTYEDNAAGSLTFTMPECNAGYHDLVLMQSNIKVYKHGTEIWEGRAIKDSIDFWKNRAITCEGILGYLNDVVQPQRVLPDDGDFKNFQGTPEEFLRIIIDYHNKHHDKQFYIGNHDVTVVDKMKNEDQEDEYFEIPSVYTDFKNTLECISEKLTGNEDLEGHLYADKDENNIRHLHYLKNPTHTSNQVIEFGKNLLDFTKNFDETEYCTVIYPRGESFSDGSEVEGLSGYVTIDEIENPSEINLPIGYTMNYPYITSENGIVFKVDGPRLINQNGIDTFGYIEKVIDFNDKYTGEDLLSKTLEWTTKHRFGNMEIDIKAFDLSMMNVDAEEIHFMDYIRVISLPHALDRYFPVLGVSIPLDKPENTTYTLGDKKVASLSAWSSKSEAETKQSILETQSNTLYRAKKTAGELIKNCTEGYITITHNDNGSQELYISNKPNPKESDQYWVWNLHGLGYFDEKKSQTPQIAITMDGAINANFITVGDLNCDRLNGGTINGQNINGGAITATTITGTDISGSTISGSTISGGSVDGALIKTNRSGWTGHIELNNGVSKFYAYDVNNKTEKERGQIYANGLYPGLILHSNNSFRFVTDANKLSDNSNHGLLFISDSSFRYKNTDVLLAGEVASYIKMSDGTTLQQFYNNVVEYMWSN